MEEWSWRATVVAMEEAMVVALVEVELFNVGGCTLFLLLTLTTEQH